MKLIIGLGNPGDKYKHTRHNVGFLATNKIRKYYNLDKFVFKKKFNAEISKGIINKQETILVRPQTFMNNSGEAVKLLKTFYKIELENITVIHDDVDIQLGKIKLQSNRGSAGHNGVKSIISALGSKNFSRIRIGIKNDETINNIPTEKYVLGKLTKEELDIINKSIKKILL